MNELLDDIPCGVVMSNENGDILYANSIASKLLNCNLKTDQYNVTSFIDSPFVEKFTNFLDSVKNNKTDRNFIYLKLKGINDIFYRLTLKRSKFHKENFIITLHEDFDYSDEFNDKLIRNSLVLKAISNICNNVLYKDRSNLSEILLKLSTAFRLQKAAICFKNGTGHLVYADRQEDNTYKVGKSDGDFIKNKCEIWKNEEQFITSKDLIFKVNSNIVCDSTIEQNTTVNILKLKLNSQKVIGFFEFVEDCNFKLSDAELEILESLSQLLAYIVNNREQVTESTNYIKEKFKSLTQTKI